MWFDDSFFEEMKRMQRELDRMFQHFYGMEHPLLPGRVGEAERGASLYRVPVTDLRETESGFIAAIELPGVEKKDIELTVTERAIEVKVNKSEEKSAEDREKGLFSHLAVSRQFYRSFPLPKPVVPEKAKAELRQGVLRVEVPKAGKTGGSQRINID